MTTTELDFLFQVEPPWICVGPGESERVSWIPDHFYSRRGLEVCVRRVRGWKMRTSQALMNEFGAALQLFDGFGENWHALEESLGYMDEWLPADAYVLVAERAEELLEDEPGHLASFLKTIDAVGDFWANPVEGNGRFDRGPKPFHLLLHVSDRAAAADDRIVQAALEAKVAVRRVGS